VRGTIGTPKPEAENFREMSFLDHLGELRKVLVQSCVVFTVLMVVCWFFSGRILDVLVRPLPVKSLYFNSPMEAFMVRVNISLAVGFMLAFPFILFRVWAFVSPGLFSHERKKIFPFVVASSALFYAGVLFCYIVLIPIALKMLLSFGTARVNPLISVNSYFGFVARMCFAFGVVFQLPVAVLILSILGIVTPRWLVRQWRNGVVVILVASAVLTPTQDALSMMAMAIPVMVLYAASILIAFVIVRKKTPDE
jgi:sec-independent protein translocase protein TatC